MIAFTGRVGQHLFAFDATTDPYEVVLELAWTFPRKVSTCSFACPTVDGSYCIDCHSTAAAAADTARRRWPEKVS